MLKNTKIREIRLRVLQLKAVVKSNIFRFSDTMHLNKLSQRAKKFIEDSYADDLDYIEASAERIVKETKLIAEKATKNSTDPQAYGRKFSKLLNENEDYGELREKELEIFNAEIAFGIDTPFRLNIEHRSGKDLSELIPDVPVYVQYRGQPEGIDVTSALFELEEAGLIELVQSSKKKKKDQSDEESED